MSSRIVLWSTSAQATFSRAGTKRGVMRVAFTRARTGSSSVSCGTSICFVYITHKHIHTTQTHTHTQTHTCTYPWLLLKARTHMPARSKLCMRAYVHKCTRTCTPSPPISKKCSSNHKCDVCNGMVGLSGLWRAGLDQPYI